MEKFDKVLRSMDLEFFGSGKHKINPSVHFSTDNALLLDVRSKQENETLSFPMIHHMPVLHIPVSEIPDRFNEIPKDKPVGIFCSGSGRSTIVYAYLRSKGFENVRIIIGGYSNVIEELKPGKLLKKINNKKS